MLLGRPERAYLRENSQDRTNQEWEEVRSSVQGSQEPINTHPEELLLWAPPNSLMGAVWLFQWSLSFCSFFLSMTDISPFLSICKFVFSPSRCLSTFTVGGCKVLFQSQICNCNFVFGTQRLLTFALGPVTATLVFLYEICNSYFVSEIIRNSLRAEVAACLKSVTVACCQEGTVGLFHYLPKLSSCHNLSGASHSPTLTSLLFEWLIFPERTILFPCHWINSGLSPDDHPSFNILIIAW